MIKYILFDLDGTITNPKEGITKSIQYALKAMGIEVNDLDSLCKHIGPPLKDGFKEFWGFDEMKANLAVEKYRERYVDTGIYENYEYEGISDLFATLTEKGYQLIVATSKPEKFAKQIMEHFDLSKYFRDVCGSSMDSTRSKKGDVIRYALEKNQITNPEEVIMVGDRYHDILGAKENGIPAIAVLYGFGNREEFITHGADYIIETVQELKSLLITL
ncbi:MAG: phosphatase [Anaerocolumna sp.]|nr:phosphatase [Anaerocolumna sp.]